MTRPVFKRTARALGAAVLVLVAATPLSAQSLEQGSWTGTLTGPGGDGFDVSVEVSGEGEELSIVMSGPGGEAVEFENVRHDGESLHLEFAFEVVTVSCDLEGAEDGSYAGDCVGSDGQSGVLEIHPPADG